MRFVLILGLIVCVVHQIVAPPVNQNKEDEKKDENEVHEEVQLEETMEYHRYLKEVVQALESDPEFRKKLEKADEVDIRSGKIAQELELVNHQVRSKLDELKRNELERLRHLAIKEYELENGLDTDHLKIAEHLDHQNTESFEIDDLKKLIAKTTEDLKLVDRKRREAFKEYEMQKKFEKEQKLKGMTEEDQKKYEEEQKAMEEKHKKHTPLHHPGSQQQLEEVWEKQDHMENQEFNPRTFFYLHDLDGNKVWDQNEVKALFLKELDKMYQEGAPEDDLLERAEEMERMREHVFKEADTNNDGLIDFQEFLEQTKKPEFKKDEGWEGLDQQQVYSQQEYEAFEKRRAEEIQKLIAKGVLPPMPDYGHHQQFPQHGMPQQNMHQQGMPQQNLHHPGMPQQHQSINNQIPHQQYQQHQGIPPQGYQVPQHQQPGQYQQPPQYNAPQQQHYQGQVPPAVQAQQIHPQQQAYQPQGQVHGQLPPQHQPAQGQQQVYQNQLPQQQMQFQQPPVQHQQPIVPQANVQPVQPINTNAQQPNAIPQQVELNQIHGQEAKHVESNAVKT